MIEMSHMWHYVWKTRELYPANLQMLSKNSPKDDAASMRELQRN